MSQSIRRCKGRCVTGQGSILVLFLLGTHVARAGPDAGAFVASVVLIVVCASLSVAFDLRFFVARGDFSTLLGSGWGWVALAALYVWLQLVTLGALFRTSYTDPGKFGVLVWAVMLTWHPTGIIPRPTGAATVLGEEEPHTRFSSVRCVPQTSLA
jgi:hypothetical protein